MSLRVAFYVSGHGYGHATRACILISLLCARGHSVTVITAAKRFLFDEVAAAYPTHFSYRYSSEIDVSPVQETPVKIDERATERNLRAFLDNMDDNAKRESELLLHGPLPNLILADAPFMPCVVASRREINVPAVLVTNFTWDSVFAGYLTGEESNGELLRRVTAAYKCASALVRLPGYIGIPAFAERAVIDAPLIHRRETKSSDNQVRDAYRIPRGKRVLLVTFGGHDNAALLSSHDELLPGDDWICVLVAPGYQSTPALSRITKVSPDAVYIPDLVRVADVVLGKLGYGTCSEVIAMRTPMVFVAREGFVEEEGLRALMREKGRAVEMSAEDFARGKWSKSVSEAAELSWGEDIPELGNVNEEAINVILDAYHNVKKT